MPLDEFADNVEPQPYSSKPPSDLDFLINEVKKAADRNQQKLIQWNEIGPNEFMAVGKTNQTLDVGVYEIGHVKGEPLFSKKRLNLDGLLEFPDSKADGILKEIEHFWTRGKIFANYDYLHRRGYMFYGPAGSGKTALVEQITGRIVGHNGIVFMCKNPELFSNGLAVFREVEPDRPIVCLFEDIDEIVNRYGEAELLSVLDGERQVNKVLNIATTNYPERLEKRLVGRPRRFDRVIKIGMPDEKVRRAYFKHKLEVKDETLVQELAVDDKELAKWVKSSEGFSFAAMAELVISVKCLGKDFNQSVKTIKELLETKVSSDDYEGKHMGFGSTED